MTINKTNMKYTIEEKKRGVLIIIDPVENKKALMDNFELCQKGQCACPTTEYTKLESMNITDGQNQIKIELNSKTDQKLQASEIAKCLEFTLNKSSKL